VPQTLVDGASGFNPTVSVPLAGEARTAVSVRAAPQKLLDSTHWLQTRVLELRERGLASSTVGVEVRCFPRFIGPSTWTQVRATDEAGVASVPAIAQTIADTDECMLEIPGFEATGDPTGAVGSAQLITVGVVVCGNNHGALPAVMPQLKIYEIAPGKAYAGTDGRWPTPTMVSSTIDPTATHAAYDQPHVIEITGLAMTASQSDRFYLRLRGESGANSAAGRLTVGWVYAVWRSAGGTFP